MSEIDGDLSFFGTGWDQSQFADLRRVTGTLRLSWFACQPYFLKCVEHVGSLVIDHPYDCFGSLYGFENLREIEELLSIKDAPGMLSLSGLLSLVKGPSKIEVKNAPMLTTLGDLMLPSAMTFVLLDQLPSVADLGALHSLESVGTLTLSGLHSLDTLSGLENLSMAERFDLGSCPSASGAGLDGLGSLVGLDSLASVSKLSIVGNDGLTALSGAPMLTWIDDAVIIGSDALPEGEIVSFLAQNSNPNSSHCYGDVNACPCL